MIEFEWKEGEENIDKAVYGVSYEELLWAYHTPTKRAYLADFITCPVDTFSNIWILKVPENLEEDQFFIPNAKDIYKVTETTLDGWCPIEGSPRDRSVMLINEHGTKRICHYEFYGEPGWYMDGAQCGPHPFFNGTEGTAVAFKELNDIGTLL